MDLSKFPKQYQLLYTLSKSLFVDREFKCVAIISKTPYLTALAACHGAKVKILPPYELGTCLLLPKQDEPNKYIHAVIEGIVNFSGNQDFYWYRYRKVRSNSKCDPGREAKPCSEIEQFGKVFLHKTPENWLGKRDITFDELQHLTNSVYPVLIGHDAKAKLDYWKKIPLGMPNMPKLTMESLLNLSASGGKFSDINTYSPRSFNSKKVESQIWVNDVPENIDHGRFLIILSPSHHRYQDLIDQVNNLYAENRLARITSQSIPSTLIKLGITNKALLVGTLMREAAS